MPIEIKIMPHQFGAGEVHQIEGSDAEFVDLVFIDQNGISIAATVEINEFSKMIDAVKARKSGLAVPPKPKLVLPG